MKPSRRYWLSKSLVGMLGMSALEKSFNRSGAQEVPSGSTREKIPDGTASKGMVTEQAERAIQRGLAFLNSRRHRDGSFGTGDYSGNVAITSLAAMAFMCGGYQPNRGVHGKVILDALRFVLSKENLQGGHPGFLHNPAFNAHGPMYGHGFATLFLGEVYGMVHDKVLREEVREKLQRAVKLILSSQKRNVEGGWRYNPTSHDADLSVTICQIMALRSARNAGILVPKSAVDRCTNYVKFCQDRMEGWFRYMKSGGGGGGQQGFARTAAGVCALNAAGIYQGPEVEAGLKFLRKNRPNGGAFTRPDIHYFYGHYYAVQAMWTAGGTYWSEWFPAIRDELIGRQNPDGSWIDQICSHYGTAMACIILQVPNNYLPILQK
ncbi:MAG: prenyltransferase/squalene oxidase repeat-containing protein [Gemmataceae bacterium]